MANTYRKVYLHIVFAAKNRDALLHRSWRPRLFSYIAGTIKQRGHFSLAVNGYADHVHILMDYNLNELVPDLVREIKKASTKYIKDNQLSPFKFEWQTGYGIFSVGWREVGSVMLYIRNQEEHHKNRSFKDEYLSLLKKYDVDYKDEYVFKFLTDVV